MGLRFIQYLWFTLLAMVLPSQALACPTACENEPSNRQLISKNVPLVTAQSAILSAKQSVDSSPSLSFSAPPVRSANVILHAFHLERASRFQFQSDDDPIVDSTSPSVSSPELDTYRLAGASLGWFTHSHRRHFRLAGWKETNALYVALNSQFSISS